MDDLESIAIYTVRQWGEEQSVKYTRQIWAALQAIQAKPNSGRERYGVPKVIRGRKSGSHVIFYRCEGQTIYIMRILHESMDHGRHL